MLPEAKALANAGWDSVIITNLNSKNIVGETYQNLRCYNVPMQRNYDIKTALKCILKLYKIFRKERFYIVQYGTTHACLFGSIAAFLARVPNRIFLQWGPTGYSDFIGIKRIFTKSIEVLIGKLSTTIRATSQKNLENSVSDNLYPRKKASVVGAGGTIGVDLSDYPIDKRPEFRTNVRKSLGLTEADTVFGFVGRISKAKGTNELLEAFKKLKDKHNCKLLLIGPNETHHDIPLLEWAKDDPDVIFTGSVSHSLISQYIAAFDVMVHPTYREGFGMVLQEALAIGTPIITTNIPGPSEVIEEGESGWLVAAKDSESLFQKMEEAILHPEICESFSKEGRQRAEKHFDRKIRLNLLVEDKETLFQNS